MTLNLEMLRTVFGDETFDADFAEKVFGWRDGRRAARTDRKRGCSECPVKDGMYAPFAELLRLLPADRQRYYLDRWWCHTDTRFCCNGAREYVETETEQEKDHAV